MERFVLASMLKLKQPCKSISKNRGGQVHSDVKVATLLLLIFVTFCTLRQLLRRTEKLQTLKIMTLLNF